LDLLNVCAIMVLAMVPDNTWGHERIRVAVTIRVRFSCDEIFFMLQSWACKFHRRFHYKLHAMHRQYKIENNFDFILCDRIKFEIDNEKTQCVVAAHNGVWRQNLRNCQRIWHPYLCILHSSYRRILDVHTCKDGSHDKRKQTSLRASRITHEKDRIVTTGLTTHTNDWPVKSHL